jgi:16S rRNA (cytosine1402-N4)-methyltransferase
MSSEQHVSVLKDEFLKAFEDVQIKSFLDATVGAGGHAEALLEAHSEIECYIACDRDIAALEISKKRLERFGSKVHFVHGNHEHLDRYVKQVGVKKIDGFFLT